MRSRWKQIESVLTVLSINNACRENDGTRKGAAEDTTLLWMNIAPCLLLFPTCLRSLENDCCDRSVLVECRRTKTLLLLRDRTEIERDELRAACRRRREEAAVRDKNLGLGGVRQEHSI